MQGKRCAGKAENESGDELALLRLSISPVRLISLKGDDTQRSPTLRVSSKGRMRAGNDTRRLDASMRTTQNEFESDYRVLLATRTIFNVSPDFVRFWDFLLPGLACWFIHTVLVEARREWIIFPSSRLNPASGPLGSSARVDLCGYHSAVLDSIIFAPWLDTANCGWIKERIDFRYRISSNLTPILPAALLMPTNAILLNTGELSAPMAIVGDTANPSDREKVASSKPVISRSSFKLGYQPPFVVMNAWYATPSGI